MTMQGDTSMNIQDAARYTSLSEKTLRRYIKQGILPALTIAGRYEFRASDLDRICAAPPAPDTLSERIRDLERRISDLEAAFAQISRNTPTARKQPQRLTRPQNEPSTSAILPDGYVPLNELLKQHNLERQRKAVIAYLEKQGILHRGEWTIEGHAVNLALDEQGIEELERRYVR
jgi:hypothetical protein